MKLQKMLLLVLAIFLLTASAMPTCAQSDKTAQLYKNMSRNERLVFVGEQARRIARDMSGTEYEFTPAFEEDILKAVTYYAERVGVPEKADLRLVLERGQTQAPLLIAAAEATAALFADQPALDRTWVSFLAGFDVVFFVATWLLCNFLIQE